MPDPFQERFNGLRKVRVEYGRVFVIKNAVDTIHHNLFGYPDGDLRFETDSEEARELLIEHFWRHRTRISFDTSYIYQFLANAGAALATIGRVFFAMVWNDDGKQLVRMNRLPSETMRAERRGGKIWRYRQQYSVFTSNEMIQEATPRVGWNLDEEVRGTTFYFSPDEIFFLEWPFDPKGRKGYPPAREAIEYVNQWKSFFERTTLQAKAMAYPELDDWRHFRARGYDLDYEMRRQKQAEINMRKPFRVVQDVPVTNYYDVWQLKEMLQFIGKIRQYLLDEFNQQVVGAILRRNGLDVQAKYVCDYKLTNQEIQKLFEGYVRGDIGHKEVVDEMLKDKT
jgi:hypothetical protein